MGKRTNKDSYCIYVHEFPNGKKYIGQTCVDPEVRWRKGKRYSGLMRRAIDKYGWDNVEHIILVRGLDADTANIVERSLIAILETNDPQKGYNITSGGDGCRDITRSEGTKQRLSEKAKEQWQRQRESGYVPPPITEEHRKHLSESHKGQHAWNKGKRTMTGEMKARLKIARERFWEEVRKGKRPNPNKRNNNVNETEDTDENS